MLKHCQATANDQTRRSRRNLSCQLNNNNNNNNLNKSDSQSVSSSQNFFMNNHESPDFRRASLYSSPDQPLSMNSRASSFASLNLTNLDSKMSPIKIYARCLRSDIEYKTLSISHRTTSTEVIWMLLSKYKMRHRDPKLFYLTMEIGVQADNVSTAGSETESSRTLVLDDDARPAELKSCYPWGDCRFTLQMRKGGLVRIHDSVLMAESKYKCLLISDQTTVREVINILFHCYGLERIERVDRFCIYEVFNSDFQNCKKLRADDCPAVVQSSWTSPSECQFILKRDHVQTGLSTPMEVSTPMSTTSSSASTSTSSERSLSSCDEHMDETEVSMDTSYSNSSASSSASTSSESPVPPSSPERMSASSASSTSIESPIVAPRMTLNQSVQTSVVRNGLHLNNNALIGRCTSVDGPPRSLPAVVRTKNQMSQTNNHFLPLVHKPVQKTPPQQQQQQQQQPKTNFNLNYPVTSMPPCILSFQHQQHQQQQQRVLPVRMTSLTSIHESGLPPPPPKSSQANRVLLSLTSSASQPQSLLTMGPGTRRPVVSFHDYENYFYI